MLRSIGALIAWVLAGALAGPSAGAEPADAPPACISHWGEARARGLGYDHVVHIKSACAKTADCVVSTDVSPDPLKIVVPAGGKVEVITFVQSPATGFKPKVACKLRP